MNDLFYPQVLKGADEPDDFKSPLKLLAKTISFQDPVSGSTRYFESKRQLIALP
jgi:tRNA pseudouridine32 synthase/23S rRNA pseudouridine746 synthase